MKLIRHLVSSVAFGALQVVGLPAHAQSAALVADPNQGEVTAKGICAACHGADGNPSQKEYPRLAGQFHEYLEKQLRAFQAPSGQRAHRTSPVMQPLAAGLTSQQIVDIAAFYSRQKPASASPVDPSRVAAGRRIYFEGNIPDGLPACVSCHRVDGSGMPPDFPRLAGQQPAYVSTQLHGWLENRGGPAKLMSMIVPHLKPEEMEQVADFLAQLKTESSR